MTTTRTDRRPWLIISKREGEVIRESFETLRNKSDDLYRALRVIERQLEWLDGNDTGVPPSIENAARRGYAQASSPVP